MSRSQPQPASREPAVPLDLVDEAGQVEPRLNLGHCIEIDQYGVREGADLVELGSHRLRDADVERSADLDLRQPSSTVRPTRDSWISPRSAGSLLGTNSHSTE
jgi:hypothetical protein